MVFTTVTGDKQFPIIQDLPFFFHNIQPSKLNYKFIQSIQVERNLMPTKRQSLDFTSLLHKSGGTANDSCILWDVEINVIKWRKDPQSLSLSLLNH